MNPNQKVSNVATFRRNLGDVLALEKAGFKLKITRMRLSEEDGSALHKQYEDTKRKKALNSDILFNSLGCTPNEHLKSCVDGAAEPFHVLRREHEASCRTEALKAGAVDSAAYKEAYAKLIRQSYISPFGGLFDVEVTTPSGDKYAATSRCHISDMYNNRIARHRAFGAVFGKMFEDAGLGDPQGKGAGKKVLSKV